ncbi:MAG: ACT domain-containing protein [Actinomycetales bacterium]|nr:MAG: ACT domain-containing protein [Actinomycetales bacterium]
MTPQILRVLPGRHAIVAGRPSQGDEVAAFVDAPDDPTTVREARAGEETWRAISSHGSAHGLETAGMTASLLVPLAAADVGVFVTSTSRADLVHVAEAQLDLAVTALTEAGHVVER